MIIGTCGFGSTGSSVITDYLREYDRFSVLDGVELTVASQPDGLADLKYHLMSPHSRTSDSICAMERFRYLVENKMSRYLKVRMGITQQELVQSTEAFLDEITQVRWLSYQNHSNSLLKKWFGDRIIHRRIFPILQKRGIQYTGYPFEQIRFSVHPDNFDTAAQQFVDRIMAYMGADLSKDIVLDQPFPGNNPQACMPFFRDSVAIVVDRDPRDLYCFSKTKLKGRNMFMPTSNVKDFVSYYRAIRKDQPYTQAHPRILKLQFEDMVYDYDKTTAVLRQFLNLGENPAPKSIFDPSLSVANTQVFVRFPQFAEDVAYIEENLPEYLFDFSRFEKPDLSGKMFFGKSPKNTFGKK